MTASVMSSAPEAAAQQLLSGFSLEVTGKDLGNIDAASRLIPHGTRVNVTYLGGEEMSARLAVAAELVALGLTPVPHISARRLASMAALDDFLAQLSDRHATDHVLLVSGDPPRPEGPFEDALAVIRSGVFERHGMSEVGIGGYPEGHPEITDDALWAAMDAKVAALDEHGLSTTIITQFGFDVDAVVDWVDAVRARGIQAPIRVGVPGPAGVKRLLSYAKRFGVGSGTRVARKYGLSLTNLLGTAGPDRFVNDLAAAYDPQRHGEVTLHFYTFGGLDATAEWIAKFSGQTGA